MLRETVVLSAVVLVGCTSAEPDAGAAETDEATEATSDGSTSTTSTTDPSGTLDPESSTSSGPSTSTTDPESETSSSGSGTGPGVDCSGRTASTLVYNGETHATEPVAATCRGEGERTVVFVQDELWESAVDQAAVDAFMHRFEEATPETSVDPDRGVIHNNEAVFGALQVEALPDGKLAIFVVDSGGGGDGYLCGWCDYPQLHLDGRILQPLDGDFSISIAAHESYHVIHRGRDADEEMWVDESLAEAAMTVNGFFTDTDWLADFLATPDQNWGPGGPGLGEFNYGAALLWGTFLWEHGGADLMAAITAEPTDGWAGLDAALTSTGDDKTAYALYLRMLASVYLDQPELGYGFASFPVENVARAGNLQSGAMQSGGLTPYGVDYYGIVTTGDLMISLASDDPDVLAQAVVSDGSAVVVTEIATSTAVAVAAGDIAFVMVTGRGSATYELTLQ